MTQQELNTNLEAFRIAIKSFDRRMTGITPEHYKEVQSLKAHYIQVVTLLKEEVESYNKQFEVLNDENDKLEKALRLQSLNQVLFNKICEKGIDQRLIS